MSKYLIDRRDVVVRLSSQKRINRHPFTSAPGHWVTHTKGVTRVGVGGSLSFGWESPKGKGRSRRSWYPGVNRTCAGGAGEIPVSKEVEFGGG